MSTGALGQLAALVTAAGAVGWLASLITIKATRRKILSEAGRTDADAAEKIKKSALDLVAEMESDAKDARAEVRGLRSDVRKLELQLGEALAEGREAINDLRRLKSAILDPQATVGALRDLVTRSSRNGMP
jgi:seryl-tRNA synthetase